MKKFILLLVLFSGFVFAEGENKDDGISDLKLGCTDPGRFHNQMPPTDIKITCQNTVNEWVWEAGCPGEHMNHRTICTKAITNKPRVGAPFWCGKTTHEPTPYPGGGKWKQVCKTFNTMYTVTCAQVLEMPSVYAFCKAQMDMAIEGDTELQSVKDTGLTRAMCGMTEMENGKPAPGVSQKQ